MSFSSVFFSFYCVFFLLCFSLLLELDKEELPLEEMEVELLLLVHFILFILGVFLRLLSSLSFSGVLASCI